MIKNIFWLSFYFIFFSTVTCASRPPYLQAEAVVKAEYQKYLERFQRDFKLFQAHLIEDAPELLKALILLEPEKINTGYQILPQIKKDLVPIRQENQIVHANIYSWPLTLLYIQDQIPILEEMEEKLKIIKKIPLVKRKNIYGKMIDETLTMREDQKTIDSHIRYNSFWQKAIFEDRHRFNEMTKMYNLVLERNDLFREIQNRQNPYFIDDLKKRANAILDKIHHFIDSQMKLASFVKITHKAHAWIIQVPLYTDIEDKTFLKEFKRIIEKKWSLEPFRLKLEMRHISKNASFPHLGDPVDIEKHIKFFPKDGGILTTGATTTYSVARTYTQLGPEDIYENALAHEFGHILGFVDGYFRGYRDLGKDGFIVMEIIADPEDIMSSPTNGKVQQHHFEQMLLKQ